MSVINRSSIKQTAKSYLKEPFLGNLMWTVGIYLLIATFGGMLPVVGSFAGIFAFILYKNIERYNFEVRTLNTPLQAKRIFDFNGIWRLICGRLWAMLKMWPAYVILFIGAFVMLFSIIFFGVGAGMMSENSNGEGALFIGLLIMGLGWLIMMVSIPISIYLSLHYVLTEFILMDNPNISSKDATDLSKKMMNGHKGEWFVMTLSFLGWDLLTGLTFNILSIYTTPYKLQTFLGYYFVYRDQYNSLPQC